MDCSPRSSSPHEILQTRILEWSAISSSRGSSWLRDETHIFCEPTSPMSSELAGKFFTSEAPRKPVTYIYIYISWSNHKKLVIIHHIIKLCFFFSDENFKDLSLSNFKTQDTILLAFGTVLWQTNYIPVAYLFYNQKCILLWLYLFILSGVISLLFSSSILSTYQPGEFIFQCHIFLPFHTVHGILKARILK